jgi:hypothetical protein
MSERPTPGDQLHSNENAGEFQLPLRKHELPQYIVKKQEIREEQGALESEVRRLQKQIKELESRREAINSIPSLFDHPHFSEIEKKLTMLDAIGIEEIKTELQTDKGMKETLHSVKKLIELVREAAKFSQTVKEKGINLEALLQQKKGPDAIIANTMFKQFTRGKISGGELGMRESMKLATKNDERAGEFRAFRDDQL